MSSRNDAIKTAILEAALPLVPFDGWTDATLHNGAQAAGYSKDMVRAVFPRGVSDALICFSNWADRRMLDALAHENVSSLKIRDRITRAVEARLDALAPFKEAERLALAYWMRPMRKWEGASLAWKTADAIWQWAGDTSTDYNRYTKRTLLCGVLASTTLCWLGDASDGHGDTKSFLTRRIENVMAIGKIVGRRKTA